MSEWIPIKIRNMTEEELDHIHFFSNKRVWEEKRIYDNPLPDENQRVLVTYKKDTGDEEVVVKTSVFKIYKEGCYFYDFPANRIWAWMPLPEPYTKKETQEEKNV